MLSFPNMKKPLSLLYYKRFFCKEKGLHGFTGEKRIMHTVNLQGFLVEASVWSLAMQLVLSHVVNVKSTWITLRPTWSKFRKIKQVQQHTFAAAKWCFWRAKSKSSRAY
jgi:hypothetical protein